MNVNFKQALGMLALILWAAGCANTPFSQQPAGKKPVAKAPVVDRSTRQPAAGTYPQQSPSPQVEAGQIPEEDPLMPREYSSAYPTAPGYPNTYGGAPAARPYPSAPGAYPTAPAYPQTGGAQQPPSYPPGAATPYPPAPRPYPAQPAEGYGRTTPPAAAYPTAPRGVGEPYGAAPAPGSLPEPQPVVPRTTRTAPPPLPSDAPSSPASAPAEPAVAMATPPAAPPEPAAPAAPAPRPPQAAPPPRPPADLPPAEINREGNQAVAALLDSADKYVKSNQLDKAGASLERALRIEPRNAGIWHDLAQIRLHQGQYQQAESLASKSNNLASGNRTLQARNWKVIASARKSSGNVGGAEEAEAQAAQLSR